MSRYVVGRQHRVIAPIWSVPGASSDDKAKSTSFEYDVLGELSRHVDRRGGSEVVTGFVVDGAGRLVSSSRTGGEVVSFSYDADGRRLSESGSGGVTRFGWGASGWLESVSEPGGGVLGVVRDGVGVPWRVDAGGGDVVGSREVLWDPLSLVASGLPGVSGGPVVDGVVSSRVGGDVVVESVASDVGGVSRFVSRGVGGAGPKARGVVVGVVGTVQGLVNPVSGNSVDGGPRVTRGSPFGPVGSVGDVWGGGVFSGVGGMPWLGSGLLLSPARVLDVGRGGFLSPDPDPLVVGVVGVVGGFGYVSGRPLSLVDRTGRFGVSDWGVAGVRAFGTGFKNAAVGAVQSVSMVVGMAHGNASSWLKFAEQSLGMGLCAYGSVMAGSSCVRDATWGPYVDAARAAWDMAVDVCARTVANARLVGDVAGGMAFDAAVGAVTAGAGTAASVGARAASMGRKAARGGSLSTWGGKASSGRTSNRQVPNANTGQSVARVPHIIIPDRAWEVLKRVEEKGSNFPGLKGGAIWKNSKGQLPSLDSSGGTVTYKEWDLNKPIKGVGRDMERIVTGSDGSVYYTHNHYESFTKMQRG